MIHDESRHRSKVTGEAAHCSRCSTYLRDGDCLCGRREAFLIKALESIRDMPPKGLDAFIASQTAGDSLEELENVG